MPDLIPGRRIPDIDAVRGFALTVLPPVNLMLAVGADRCPNPDALSPFIPGIPWTSAFPRYPAAHD